MNRLHAVDVVIAGGGIIGLSLALELRVRGLSVTVFERHNAMQGASWAAGGMLAAGDPENPPGLLGLSRFSRSLYAEYLGRIEQLSGDEVPLRTHAALQMIRSGHALAGQSPTEAQIRELAGDLESERHRFLILEESSLDPRDLCRALPKAFLAAGGTLIEQAAVLDVQSTADGAVVKTQHDRIAAGLFVNCCGAWAGDGLAHGLPVEPVKGQIVSVRLSRNPLRCVVRTPEVYLIPRGEGRVVIGATIEHAGFDTTVEEQSVRGLLENASRLFPEVALAPRIAAWAGLRPATPDGLPILGPAEAPNCWNATGHYRNGILLAPATARLMTQAMLGEQPDIALHAFEQARFAAVAIDRAPEAD